MKVKYKKHFKGDNVLFALDHIALAVLSLVKAIKLFTSEVVVKYEAIAHVLLILILSPFSFLAESRNRWVLLFSDKGHLSNCIGKFILHSYRRCFCHVDEKCLDNEAYQTSHESIGVADTYQKTPKQPTLCDVVLIEFNQPSEDGHYLNR